MELHDANRWLRSETPGYVRIPQTVTTEAKEQKVGEEENRWCRLGVFSPRLLSVLLLGHLCLTVN